MSLRTPLEVWTSATGTEAIAHITQFCFVWVCVWLPFGLPMSFRFQWVPFKPLHPQQKLILLLPLYAIAIPIFVIWANKQHHFLSDYGLVLQLHFWEAGLLGFVVGVFSFAVLMATERACGWITVRGLSSSLPTDTPKQQVINLPQKIQQGAILIGLLLIALLVSFVEEFLFRGFLWAELRPVLTWLGAAIASSWIFAVLHLIWEGWLARSQLVGLTLMGLVLCVARWVDQDQLGLAWGLHAGWVWQIASIDTFQCLEYTPAAPLWLVGEPGQPLTGGLTLMYLLVVMVLLMTVQFFLH